MTPKVGEPQGDMGIGLCAFCTIEYKAAPKEKPFPAFAVTMQPAPVPMPGALVVLALPACYGHVQAATPEQAASQTRRPLLLGGAMP